MADIDLNDVFTDDREVASGDGIVTLKLHPLGGQILPTGKIVACDPFAAPETGPFTIDVPPGRYPVVLSVARFPNGDQRVAYAALKFYESPPRRWELALLPGQDVSTLEAGHFFGYGVDAGTGCFMDAEVGRALAGMADASDEWGDELVAEMEKTYVHTWSWANKVIQPSTGANLVTFSSGWGDGAYASYWGYDEDARVVALITDFGLFYEGEDGEEDAI